MCVAFTTVIILHRALLPAILFCLVFYSLCNTITAVAFVQPVTYVLLTKCSKGCLVDCDLCYENMPKTRKCIKTQFLLCFALPSSFVTIPILFSIFRTLHFIVVTERLLIKTNGKCSLGSTVKNVCLAFAWRLLLYSSVQFFLIDLHVEERSRKWLDNALDGASFEYVVILLVIFSKSILKKWNCVFYGSLYCMFYWIYFFFQLNLYFVRLCLGPTANKCQTL